MGISADKVFVNEFKRALAVIPKSNNIYELPNLPGEEEIKPKGKALYVNGIEDSYYKLLNGTEVESLQGQKIAKKVLNADGTFKRDATGDYDLEDVTVPSGRLAVKSTQKLKLPYKYTSEVDEGLIYVDYIVTKENGLEYIYLIPKGYLYEVNKTALVISKKSMKGFEGRGLRTWSYGQLNIYVIPYNPKKEYIATKILKVKVGLDYAEEIKAYTALLVSKQIVADPTVMEVDYNNLVLVDLPDSYSEYNERSEFSILELESQRVGYELGSEE